MLYTIDNPKNIKVKINPKSNKSLHAIPEAYLASFRKPLLFFYVNNYVTHSSSEVIKHTCVLH